MGSNPIARFVSIGDVAKWKGSGLQNRDHGFKSRRRLWANGLVAVCYQPFVIRTGRWRNGRRCGLKTCWGRPRVGSNPTRPTSSSPPGSGRAFAFPNVIVPN